MNRALLRIISGQHTAILYIFYRNSLHTAPLYIALLGDNNL